jgi:predicted PurR-regulated permease PerM
MDIILLIAFIFIVGVLILIIIGFIQIIDQLKRSNFLLQEMNYELNKDAAALKRRATWSKKREKGMAKGLQKK